MKTYKDYLPHAKEKFETIRALQSEGLICDDGEFVPSVHYPPITQYDDASPDEALDTYTQPEDGRMDIYAHFPFCIQSCTFCHYPGLVGEQAEEKEKYLKYLKKEIEIYYERFQIERLRPRSVLIGGGTPTHLTPAMLEDFLQFFNQKVDLSGCRQFNYDVDPNSLVGDDGKKRLEIMRAYGVTRLTIGVQSFDNQVLKYMNRAHNAATAIESIENTKEFGFDLNIEFIFGHPGETLENWTEVMQKVVTMNTDEIQLYRLKVLSYGDKQGYIINQRDKIPDFEQTMMMKQIAIDILNENGFYENLRRVFTKDKKNISHYAYNQCCNL
ncbi:MAG: radical SAM protein, partial [Oscillospiraceae bacterium]|nr:radical SAM protein [Oscillospiraceae bacterium]